MASTKPYIPQFPYAGAQILVTSDRVVVHSKEDAIFLFGKQAIGFSSPGRINFDSGKGVTINAPEIELGLLAKDAGEPVTKALSLSDILNSLLRDLEKLSTSLKYLSDTNFQESIVDVVKTSSKLAGTCSRLRSKLGDIKSKTTFTR